MNVQQQPTSDYDVYTGLWINRSRGYVYGATITLSRQSGSVLIAFLALYVTLAGSGCWKIVRLLLHRTFSTSTSPDGIYLQRQAILRNSETSHSAAWELLQASLAWRTKRAKHNIRRLWPIIGLSLTLTLVFAAAGIMSSHVTSSNANTVLLLGNQCGMTKQEAASDYDFSQIVEENVYRAKKYTEYLTYALQCYRGNRNSEKCRTFTTPQLPYKKTLDAPCPFADGLCRSNTTVTLDTGYLSSDEHLGFNGKPEFLLRQVRQCAPLATEQFQRNYTNEETGEQSLRFYMAPWDMGPDANASDRGLVTWQTPRLPTNRSQADINGAEDRQFPRSYRLGVVSQFPADQTDHLLVPARNRPDALTSLLFLDASEIFYGGPVQDPWFAATTSLYDYSGPDWNDIPENARLYTANEAASVVGCSTDTFVCNPQIPNVAERCVKAYNRTGFGAALSSIWLEPNDRAAVQGALRFIESGDIFNADVFYGIANLPTLITQYSLKQATQLDPLPKDRWQLEMEYGFQASLASLQAAMVETATGGLQWMQSSNDTELIVKGSCEPHAACRSVCERQMIKSPGHYSFSLLGVCIILCIGGSLILVGAGIESMVAIFEHFKFRGGRSYASLEWQTGSALQMQRLAHEALGLGAWSRTDGDIPITEAGDVLGVLDVSDSKHARLRLPNAADSDMDHLSRGVDVVNVSTKGLS